MTLHDEIFPPGPPRDGLIALTRYVGSWESQFRGAGRLTSFLTEYLLRFSAAVDDIALYVVFLQRHRVEVGLKLVLERTSAAVPATHNVADLWSLCSTALSETGQNELSEQFWRENGEIIELIHDADPQSFAYRYPFDRALAPAKREEHVDLKELEAAGASFQRGVVQIVDARTALEPIPVDAGQRDLVAQEIASAIRAIRTVVAFNEQLYVAIAKDHERIAGLIGRPTERDPSELGGDARAASDEFMELLRTVEPQILLLLRRLGPMPAPISLDAYPIEPAPQWSIANRDESLDRAIKYTARGVGDNLIELKRTMITLGRRAADWPSHADQQLHADLGRFVARLMTGVNPLDQPGAPPNT